MSEEKSCHGKLSSANFTFGAFEHARHLATLLYISNICA